MLALLSEFWIALGAIGAFLQAAFVGVALLYARGQLKEVRKQRSDAQEQAQLLVESTHRPYVVVWLNPNSPFPFGHIEIQNLGTTAAAEVRFTFDQPLASTLDELAMNVDHPLRLQRIFSQGMATLAPGQVVSVLFDDGTKRFGTNLPDSYVVSVAYRSPVFGKPYTDEFTLDWSIFWTLRSIHLPSLYDINKSLGQIKTALEGVGREIGGLGEEASGAQTAQ